MKGNSKDDDLRVRPGRIRSRGARAGPRSFFAEVRKAAQKAGYAGARSRPGGRLSKYSTFDYSIHGMRARAADLVTTELGPKSRLEIQSALERDVMAERWTRLDRAVACQADGTGLIDLRPSPADQTDPEIRRLMIGRLQRLERWGLAMAEGAARWVVSEEAEHVLRDLGIRRDMITTMHHAMAEQGIERPIADYKIYGQQDRPQVAGRLVGKGMQDELTGEAYAVIDGVDARVHYVRFPDLDRLEHAPPLGGIVATRAIGSSLVLSVRSDLTLDDQVTAGGATWLDHQLLVRDKSPLSEGGFGREVREALQARVDHLASEGLVRRDGNRIIFARDLLDRLRRREIDSAVAQVAAETGLVHRPAFEDDTVAGTYRRRLNLASGRFAMIGDGLGFSLVPWRPALEQELGRQVSGIVRSSGIEWTLGRQRGLGIG